MLFCASRHPFSSKKLFSDYVFHVFCWNIPIKHFKKVDVLFAMDSCYSCVTRLCYPRCAIKSVVLSATTKLYVSIRNFAVIYFLSNPVLSSSCNIYKIQWKHSMIAVQAVHFVTHLSSTPVRPGSNTSKIGAPHGHFGWQSPKNPGTRGS